MKSSNIIYFKLRNLTLFYTQENNIVYKNFLISSYTQLKAGNNQDMNIYLLLLIETEIFITFPKSSKPLLKYAVCHYLVIMIVIYLTYCYLTYQHIIFKNCFKRFLIDKIFSLLYPLIINV